MVFYYKDSMQSTQIYLSSIIKSKQGIYDFGMPIIVATKSQYGGIGSRANSWDCVDCGLYISIAIRIDSLPSDLLLHSSSVYMGYILLKLFRELYACYDLDLWLKWPNDMYIADSKIGGIMTNRIADCLVFGFGLNISAKDYKSIFNAQMLDIFMHDRALSDTNEAYTLLLHEAIYKILRFFGFSVVESSLRLVDDFMYTDDSECTIFKDHRFSWNSIFYEYKSEFHRNHGFHAHVNIDGIYKDIPFTDIALADDGGIVINDKIFYSMR